MELSKTKPYEVILFMIALFAIYKIWVEPPQVEEQKAAEENIPKVVYYETNYVPSNAVENITEEVNNVVNNTIANTNTTEKDTNTVKNEVNTNTTNTTNTTSSEVKFH